MDFISIVVLAAGLSRRFGADNKLLAPIGGEALVRRVVRRALEAPVDEVVVVLGYQANLVGAALAGLDSSAPALRLVENPSFAQGQSTSVRAGLAALSPQAAAALFLPGDQVGISTALLVRLVEAWKGKRAGVVVPTLEGGRRAPVLFARQYFPELAALRGDSGGRELLALLGAEITEVEVEQALEVEDVDTPEDGLRLTHGTSA